MKKNVYNGMNSIWFKFYSVGWGGHELMAANNINALLKMNINIFISFINPCIKEKFVHEFPDLAAYTIEFNFRAKIKDNITEVIIVNSILRLVRYFITGRLNLNQIRKSYFYAPFWGFEWNDGIAKLAKKNVCNIIGRYFKERIIGISSFFFERAGLNGETIWPNTISRRYCVLDDGDDGDDDSITLVNIGRIDFEHKQQDKLVDWFFKYTSDLKFPIKKLLIIGSGVDEVKLKERVSESKSVLFLEWSNEITIPAKSILVICSKFEGLPLVALEAMASNIPVIYHNECGLNKLLDTQCAFEIANRKSMQAALIYTQKNWNQIIKNNFSTYLELHSVEANQQAIKLWIQKS